MEIIGLIPQEDPFKVNIDILGPFWRDWKWSFGHPLAQYEVGRLYSLLHQRHELSHVLNSRWVSTDTERWWIRRFLSVWLIRVSYKLWVFAWLVIYQGLLTKAWLVKIDLLNWLFPSCLY
jgi:hypothetical protein